MLWAPARSPSTRPPGSTLVKAPPRRGRLSPAGRTARPQSTRPRPRGATPAPLPPRIRSTALRSRPAGTTRSTAHSTPRPTVNGAAGTPRWQAFGGLRWSSAARRHRPAPRRTRRVRAPGALVEAILRHLVPGALPAKAGSSPRGALGAAADGPRQAPRRASPSLPPGAPSQLPPKTWRSCARPQSPPSSARQLERTSQKFSACSGSRWRGGICARRTERPVCSCTRTVTGASRPVSVLRPRRSGKSWERK